MYHNDHPVCAASEASRLFLTGAATPPVPGGEHHVLAIHSHLRGGRSHKIFRRTDHPGRASKEASRHFLDGASTPPVPRGEHPRLRPFREIWLRLSRAKLLVVSLSVFLQSGATPECLLF